MGKDAYYFSHDANARSDPKILRLLSVYGMEGYGRYWVLVEMMREQSDYCLPMDGKYDWDAYAMQMQCDRTTAAQFVHDCIDVFGLFCSDGTAFWSSSLRRRMEYKDAKSKQARMAAQARWDKEKTEVADADDMRTQCGRNADAMQGKESKGKESKEVEDASPSELEILSTLKSIPNWGFDYKKDLEQIREVATDYPTVDLVEESKTLRDWLKDRPLKKSSNPRARFRTWMKKAKEFGRNRPTAAIEDDYYKQLTPWEVPE